MINKAIGENIQLSPEATQSEQEVNTNDESV
jgi:hypothetical protein